MEIKFKKSPRDLLAAFVAFFGSLFTAYFFIYVLSTDAPLYDINVYEILFLLMILGLFTIFVIGANYYRNTHERCYIKIDEHEIKIQITPIRKKVIPLSNIEKIKYTDSKIYLMGKEKFGEFEILAENMYYEDFDSLIRYCKERNFATEL